LWWREENLIGASLGPLIGKREKNEFVFEGGPHRPLFLDPSGQENTRMWSSCQKKREESGPFPPKVKEGNRKDEHSGREKDQSWSAFFRGFLAGKEKKEKIGGRPSR